MQAHPAVSPSAAAAGRACVHADEAGAYLYVLSAAGERASQEPRGYCVLVSCAVM